MANPSKTLANQICWSELLPSLGAGELRNNVLPYTATCPLCASPSLFVSVDHVLGGEWAFCRSCRFAGDLIELAAASWKLEIPAALGKLEALDLLSQPLSAKQVSDYMRDHVQYRRRVQEFWERARQEPPRFASMSVSRLLHKVGFAEVASRPQEWAETGGQLVGAASRHEIEDLFFPASHEPQERVNHKGKSSTRRGGGPGERRLFSGRGWEDLLVIPFYDLPGRICGFLFIGREAVTSAGDIFYKRCNLGCCLSPIREAGTAMLPAIEGLPSHYFGDDVFIIGDPLIGLMLQGKWFREHSRPLPMLLSHYSPGIQTLELPDHLRDRKIIFWGTHPRLLSQAKRWNALISSHRLSPAEIAGRLSHHDPLTWLRLIKKDAKAWPFHLMEELKRLDLPKCETLLRGMEFTPAEMRFFKGNCQSELYARLAHCDPYRLSRRRIVVSGQQILETEDGWEIAGTGERLSNMAVRVEELLNTKVGESYYRGVALRGLERIPFTVPHSAVERQGLLPCVRDFLSENHNALLIYNPKWAKRSQFVAQQFHEPRVITGIDRIGWNEDERCFVFPTFSIEMGGTISTDRTPVGLDEFAPGTDLLVPSIFSSNRDWLPLSERTPETAVIWAMLACVAHNLLAPAIFRKSYGILLDGPDAQTAGRTIALNLGCVDADFRKGRAETPLDRINRHCRRHDWPAVVRLPENNHTKFTAAWLDSPGPRNAILSVNRYAALSMSSYASFCRIHAPVPLKPLGALQESIKTLVPAYIRDICQRKLEMCHGLEHPVFEVLADIAAWFAREGGNREAVSDARRVLSAGGLAPWSNLLELALHLYDEREMQMVRNGRPPEDARCLPMDYRDATEKSPWTVWVPVLQINQLLARRNAPVLDLAVIEKSLKAQGTWLGKSLHRGQEGWEIKAEWWDREGRNILGRERAWNQKVAV